MDGFKLLKFQVTNFRNLNSNIVNFSDGINCILGQNGNGKTNLLEAIHFLANKKSFRKNANFPQILSMDSGKPEIIYSATLKDRHNYNRSYSGTWEGDRSQWYLDGAIVKNKISINTIFINPFDSFSFHNSSSFRRKWFDSNISKVNPRYKKILTKYNQNLKQRNHLLKFKPFKYETQIEAIDHQFSQLISDLNSEKIHFIEEINPFCRKIYEKIFDENHELQISLSSALDQLDPAQVYRDLRQNIKKDEAAGCTTTGHHRDDYLLLFDDLNAYEFCSLGQLKMAYLSLLFAYIELFRYKIKVFPIVLMDDVSGELDNTRWQKLVLFLELSEFQVLITTANEKFKEGLEKINNVNKIYIHDGDILNNH